MPGPENPANELALELDPGLGNVLFDIWLVSRATTALLDEALQTSGLDADEFAIYSVLASSDGMTPSELARWMAAPPTTVSSYIKRFESRGHVRRVPKPDDRRSYNLRLTPAGQKRHQSAGTLFLPILEHINHAIGPHLTETHLHLQQLRQTIATINTNDS